MALRLSIIIPFYNVEKYISECLDSVFDQDIPLSDYEVICVNDGSPDGSREIVLNYMKRFPNLRLVEHEYNRKLGTARNTGRSVAFGEYLWNVDSDDKVVPNCLGTMLRICEENALDVLEFGAIQFYDNEQSVLLHSPSSEVVTTGLDYMNSLNSFQVSRLCPVWRKMIRRELLTINSIYSPEINLGEDIPYSFRVLESAQRIIVTSDNFYMYRLNPKSLTGSNWKPNPDSLYEKCFICARLVNNATNEIPKKYKNVKNAINDIASSILASYPVYLKKMPQESIIKFRRLSRKSLIKDLRLFRLCSPKVFIRHILWIAGLGVKFREE